MPVVAVGLFDAGDRHFAGRGFEQGGVADLTAAAGVQRRAAEDHRAGTRTHDLGIVFQQVRVFMTQVHSHDLDRTLTFRSPSGRLTVPLAYGRGVAERHRLTIRSIEADPRAAAIETGAAQLGLSIPPACRSPM